MWLQPNHDADHHLLGPVQCDRQWIQRQTAHLSESGHSSHLHLDLGTRLVHLAIGRLGLLRHGRDARHVMFTTCL